MKKNARAVVSAGLSGALIFGGGVGALLAASPVVAMAGSSETTTTTTDPTTTTPTASVGISLEGPETSSFIYKAARTGFTLPFTTTGTVDSLVTAKVINLKTQEELGPDAVTLTQPQDSRGSVSVSINVPKDGDKYKVEVQYGEATAEQTVTLEMVEPAFENVYVQLTGPNTAYVKGTLANVLEGTKVVLFSGPEGAAIQGDSTTTDDEGNFSFTLTGVKYKDAVSFGLDDSAMSGVRHNSTVLSAIEYTTNMVSILNQEKTHELVLGTFGEKVHYMIYSEDMKLLSEGDTEDDGSFVDVVDYAGNIYIYGYTEGHWKNIYYGSTDEMALAPMNYEDAVGILDANDDNPEVAEFMKEDVAETPAKTEIPETQDPSGLAVAGSGILGALSLAVSRLRRK